MFLFFSLRLSNLVTLNTTKRKEKKRKEKKRTERNGTERNDTERKSIRFNSSNRRILRVIQISNSQISHRSYVNRATVSKISILIVEKTCEAEKNALYYHLYHN